MRKGSFFFLHSDVTGNEGGITSSFFFRVTERTSWRKKWRKNYEQRNWSKVLLASHFQKLAPGTKFPKKMHSIKKSFLHKNENIIGFPLLCIKKKYEKQLALQYVTQHHTPQTTAFSTRLTCNSKRSSGTARFVLSRLTSAVRQYETAVHPTQQVLHLAPQLATFTSRSQQTV